MKHAEQIKKAALSRGAKGVTFKENDKSMVMVAPGYSSHSAAFDNAYDLCHELNINFGGYDSWDRPYTVTFKETKKTK